MKIIKKHDELKKFIDQLKRDSYKLSFVPTMGGLHEGHLSLVDLALSCSDKVCVSIFLNALQFSPGEDLASYPQNLQDDLSLLEKRGVDIVYIPDHSSMYPTNILFPDIKLPQIQNYLCGASRPNFFGGIIMAVVKLLMRVRPDVIILGEKDFQQFCIIDNVIKALDIDTSLKIAPIAREKSGLAYSTRNKYLTENESHKVAPLLFAMLNEVAAKIRGEPADIKLLLSNSKDELTKKGFNIDYFELRREDNFDEVTEYNSEVDSRLFVAAYLNKTRLIDNIKI